MNIHEYQAKEIFTSFGLPVPGGAAVQTVEAAQVEAQDAINRGRIPR